MKKKILVLGVSAMLTTVALPVSASVPIQPDSEVKYGFSYRNANFSADLDGQNISTNDGISEVYYSFNFNKKVSATLSSVNGSFSTTSGLYTLSGKLNYWELSLQYQLKQNLALIAGNRKNDIKGTFTAPGYEPHIDNSNAAFAGISYIQPLKNGSVYTSIKASNHFTDFVLGYSHTINKHWSADVNYGRYNYDNTLKVTAKGLGFGVSYAY